MTSDHSVSTEQHGRQVPRKAGQQGADCLRCKQVMNYPGPVGVVKMPKYYFYCVNDRGTVCIRQANRSRGC